MPSPGFKTLRTVFRARTGNRFTDPVTSRRELEEFVRILPEPDPYRTEPVAVGGVACEWVTADGPEEPASSRALVFFHGGGYVSGSLASHRALAARLARAVGARVLQVDYRRAPEHPFPAAFDDARAVLGSLLEGGTSSAPSDPPLPNAGGTPDAAPASGASAIRAAGDLDEAGSIGAPRRMKTIAVVGDSAGGGLAVAAAAALRASGCPLPAALVCLSPWTDLACTGESLETRAAADPLFDRPALERMAALYADGADRTDPRISPLYADLHGLPPTLIQVGDAEVLRSDSTRLAERLEQSGVPVELDVWPEMVHGWQLFAGMVPEGDEAIERIGRFLRAELAPRPAPRLDGLDLDPDLERVRDRGRDDDRDIPHPRETDP